MNSKHHRSKMIPVAKPFFKDEDGQAAFNVVLSGWVTQGPKVQEFEEKFASYVGSKYAVALSSCTAALHLAMIVSGVNADDEVICPSTTFIATANAIKYVGAKPIFAEIGNDYNLNVKDVERRITKKTKAILLVHQIGMPADIDAFKKLCNKYKLKLIEDAACAVGSSYKGRKIGCHSDLVCFSFHPRKVISTGDGGMITTSDEKIYKKLKLLRQHGMSVSDRERHASGKVINEEYVLIGYNYRMTDIQAAVGITQLKKLDYLVKERRKLAEIYNRGLSAIKCIDIPVSYSDRVSNIQSYAIIINKFSKVDRDNLMQKLLDRGISTRRGIMTIHRQVAYKNEYKNMALPQSEGYSDNSILLPLYVPMRRQEIDFVIKTLSEILG